MLDAGTFSKHFPLWSEQGGTDLTRLVMVGVKKCEEALPVSCPTPAGAVVVLIAAALQPGSSLLCPAALAHYLQLDLGSHVTRYTLHVTHYTAHHTSRITLGDLASRET